MTRPSIGIVTVCFRSMSVLPKMLGSVPKDVPVVLVDNAGSDADDGGLAELAAQHKAQLIRNDVNQGFGAACNQGAAVLNTDFFLFLNPDAVLTPGALDALLDAADRHPQASAFNPRIAAPDGTPVFKRTNNLLPRNQRMARGWPETDAEVNVLSGAALLVRRDAFEAVGGFDPDIFLYHEDDDLSLRLRDTCGPLIFVRDALVTHLEGRSTVRTPETAALKAWHMGRSRVYATRKHGRPMAGLRAFFLAFSQLMSPVVLFSKRKRAKQVALFRGVWSMLRSQNGAGT